MTSGKPYDDDNWEDGDIVGPVTMNEHAEDHDDDLFRVEHDGVDVSGVGAGKPVNFTDGFDVTDETGHVGVDLKGTTRIIEEGTSESEIDNIVTSGEPGDVFIFEPGTHSIDGFVVPEGVTLRFDHCTVDIHWMYLNEGCALIGDDAIVNVDNDNGTIFSSTGADNVSIEGIAFIDTLDPNVRSNTIIRWGEGDDLENFTVRDCEFYDIHFYGAINTGHSSNGSVTGCWIENNRFERVAQAYNSWNTYHLVFRGNYCEHDNEWDASIFNEVEGIDIADADNALVEGNAFINYEEEGVDCNMSNARVVNNYIKIPPSEPGFRTKGIHLSSPGPMVATGNVIDMTDANDSNDQAFGNHSGTSQWDSYTAIVGNVVIGGGTGKGVEQWDVGDPDTLVANNLFYNVDRAIHARGGRLMTSGNMYLDVNTEIDQDGVNEVTRVEDTIDINGRIDAERVTVDDRLTIDDNEGAIRFVNAATEIARISNTLRFDTWRNFEFHTGDANQRVWESDWDANVTFVDGDVTCQNGLEVTSNGGGVEVTSPDGTETKIIGIDNNGNLEARDP